ncbi:MAG: hypothetical protein ACRDOK_01405 [Streptosporangiaceae bacterium]
MQALGSRGATGGAGAAAGVLASVMLTSWLGVSPHRCLLAVAAVLLAAFAVAERLALRAGRRPLLPPQVWRNQPGISGGSGYLTGLLPGLLVTGLGAGIVLPAAAITGLNEFTREQAGIGSGLMSTAHEIGGRGRRPDDGRADAARERIIAVGWQHLSSTIQTAAVRGHRVAADLPRPAASKRTGSLDESAHPAVSLVALRNARAVWSPCVRVWSLTVTGAVGIAPNIGQK